MSRTIQLFASVGGVGLLLARAIGFFPHVILHADARRDLFRQLYATGIRTLPVVTVVSLFMGMILALQVGVELARFNQESFLGAAVMLTLLREMAAFCCGICLSACVGSAVAAELGTMKVNEEIDALHVMGISPVRFLVAPRVLALVLMAPVVAFYSAMIGTLGGGLVAMTQLSVDYSQYVSSALWMATRHDLMLGLFKSAVFGLLIGTISSWEGLQTSQGATGVGKSTQRAVIVSFLAILISGYMMTRVFCE